MSTSEHQILQSLHCFRSRHLLARLGQTERAPYFFVEEGGDVEGGGLGRVGGEEMVDERDEAGAGAGAELRLGNVGAVGPAVLEAVLDSLKTVSLVKTCERGTDDKDERLEQHVLPRLSAELLPVEGDRRMVEMNERESIPKVDDLAQELQLVLEGGLLQCKLVVQMVPVRDEHRAGMEERSAVERVPRLGAPARVGPVRVPCRHAKTEQRSRSS